MTPEEFITFAGRLAAMASGGEAAIRTIAGRAYYGAFHLVLDYLVDLGYAIPANANAHGLVRRYLSGSAHPDASQMARFMQDLHAYRIQADYRLRGTQFRSFDLARVFVENAVAVRRLVPPGARPHRNPRRHQHVPRAAELTTAVLPPPIVNPLPAMLAFSGQRVILPCPRRPSIGIRFSNRASANSIQQRDHGDTTCC
jgi:hypothetical protein